MALINSNPFTKERSTRLNFGSLVKGFVVDSLVIIQLFLSRSYVTVLFDLIYAVAFPVNRNVIYRFFFVIGLYKLVTPFCAFNLWDVMHIFSENIAHLVERFCRSYLLGTAISTD